ncbi:MAG: hypothetical protein V2I33_24760 [Kangiellaceae bacterium]|jgi:hypothetical protein|nr:hypothetical protein [Kangiellaceae bacterium]
MKRTQAFFALFIFTVFLQPGASSTENLNLRIVQSEFTPSRLSEYFGRNQELISKEIERRSHTTEKVTIELTEVHELSEIGAIERANADFILDLTYSLYYEFTIQQM